MPDEDCSVNIKDLDLSNVRRVLESLGVTPKYGSSGVEYCITVEDSHDGRLLTASWDATEKKWRSTSAAINAQGQDVVPPSTIEPTSHVSQHDLQDVSISKSQSSDPDWTAHLPQTDHVRFLKSIDWTTKGLGPMRDWPTTLRVHVQAMLIDIRSICIYWGPEKVAIYNEAWIPVVYGLHPTLMGSRYRDAFPSTWESVQPIFEHCDTTGCAFHVPGIELLVERNGYLEEAYFDGVFLPILDEDGSMGGIYNSCYEITRLKLADRRAQVLHHINTTTESDTVSIWQHLSNALQQDERDIPIALIYSAEQSTVWNTCSLKLEQLVGIAHGHPSAPQHALLEGGDSWFASTLRMARASGLPTVFRTTAKSSSPFPADTVDCQACTTFVMLPLFANGLISAFIILGLDPRRAYDEDYERFLTDLTRLSGAALNLSIGQEQARQREAKLVKELTERERFIRRLADVAPVGLFSLTMDGIATWANEKYYDLLGLSKSEEDDCPRSFMHCIHPEDLGMAAEIWETLERTEQGGIFEIRVKRTWKPSLGALEEDAWVQCVFQPNIEAGKCTGIMGCLTDVSKFLWAEKVQSSIAEAAQEAKRQQERFIDLTSHEMRNPLSAIMQCADGITTLVEESTGSPSTLDLKIMANILESAQTVLLCAAHQKRIIDDILTVSKMDSNMLTIAPILMQPVELMKSTLRMFNPELESFGFNTELVLEQTYKEHSVDWVYCDPSRLSQVLVNLLTNAIKFTKTANHRRICVRLGLSTSTPSSQSSVANVQWFPTDQQGNRPTHPPKSGDEVFLIFSVQDSGKGISDEEMARLFNRYVQADAKTHVQYGGSGLGLYISRKLTEMQGGMIGATSNPGEGSTFSFYIKAQLANTINNGDKPITVPSEAIPRPLSQNTKVGVPVMPKTSTAIAAKQQIEVLLVEDNIVNQRVLSKQLQRAGCIVHIANHGLEALDFIRTTRYWRANGGNGPDIVVIYMDWEMPVCDGLTATRKIRELEAEGLITQHLRIIGITANARAEQKETAFAAGMDDIVPKPFKVQELLNRI